MVLGETAPTSGSIRGTGPESFALAAPAFPPEVRPTTPSPLTVAATLVLTNGTSIPGNYRPATIVDPLAGTVDPGRSALYVTDSGGAVGLVNLTRGEVTATAPVGATPDAVAIDPSHQLLFVANNGSDNVSVVAQQPFAVVGSVAVGHGPSALAWDSRNDTLFVVNARSNNLTVIDTATLRSVANLPTGSGPMGVVYDSLTDRIFVANAGSSNVTVVNATSYATLANVPLPGTPAALLWNPLDDLVDVATGFNGTLAVLNGSTGAISASLRVGTDPASLALDLDSDQLFVANRYTVNVSVVNQTLETVVGTIALISTPHGLLWNPTNDVLYVAQPGAGRVTSFSATNYTQLSVIFTAGAIETNLAVFLASDTTTGAVYSVNRAEGWGQFTDNITVVDPATNLPVASIPLSVGPAALAVDPAVHELFVAAPNAGLVYILNATTGARIQTLYVGLQPTALALDQWTGDILVADYGGGNVTVIDPRTNSVTRQVVLGGFPTALAFDPVRGVVFVADASDGDIVVLNGTTYARETEFSSGAFHLVSVAFDAATGLLYAVDEAVGTLLILDPLLGILDASVPVGGDPLSAVVDPGSGDIDVAPALGGGVTVFDPVANRIVTNVTVGAGPGLAADPVLGAVLTTNTTTQTLGGFAEATYAALAPLAVGQTPTAAGIDPASGLVFVANLDSGTVSWVEEVPPPVLYPVRFVGSGQTAGASWAVAIDGAYLGTTGAQVVGYALNGSVSFLVVPPSGDIASPASGTVPVAGAATTVAILFAPIPVPEYAVTFAEVGLPVGTLWGVTLAGTDRQSAAPNPVVFNETNGVYSYTVDAVANYTSQPSGGVATVTSQAVQYTVRWTGPPPPPVKVEAWLNASASNVSLGESIRFVANATGGTRPYSYSYLLLPSGCSAGNVSNFTCTPNSTGTWHVTGRVQDSAGHFALAGAVVTVVAANGSPVGPSNSTSPSWLQTYWWVLVVALGAIASVVVVASYRRRSRPPTSSDEPAAQEGTPAEAEDQPVEAAEPPLEPDPAVDTES